MTDPWADIRELDRLFNLDEKTYGRKSELSFQEFHTLVDRRALLKDADALLAVKDAVQELRLAQRAISDQNADAVLRRVDRLTDALAALPEHLK